MDENTIENETNISSQLERIEAMLNELIDAKRMLEGFAEQMQGKGPLALMSMFK